MEYILFHEGLPSRIVDGVKRQSNLEIFSARRINNNYIALYAAIQDSGLAAEKIHTVYLSVIKKEKNTLKDKSTIDITNHLKTYLEQPGIFNNMDALMELFEISDVKQGIHINLWSGISGSGSYSSSTDLFYSIEPVQVFG